MYPIISDKLVASAVGTHSYNHVTYSTVAKDVTTLLAPGSDGINHGDSQAIPLLVLLITLLGIAQDGVVSMLTVNIK